jgi:hypothetical protein
MKNILILLILLFISCKVEYKDTEVFNVKKYKGLKIISKVEDKSIYYDYYILKTDTSLIKIEVSSDFTSYYKIGDTIK